MNKLELVKRLETLSRRKKGYIYHFFEDNSFIYENFSSIEPLNKNSLVFTKEPEDIFCVLDKELFEIKKNEAISGSGTSDLKTLKSSSLLALLCFYNIKNEPLSITLNNTDYQFTDSFFEVRNRCLRGGPSNVDVVLTGNRLDNGKPAIFYIESKFSEYFDIKPDMRSLSYAELYEDLYSSVFDTCDIKYQPHNGKIRISGPHYCYGLTQMICHHYGIMNHLSGKIHAKTKKRLKDFQMAEADILLGSILFRFNGRCDDIIIDKNKLSAFSDYRKQYRLLAGALSGVSERIIVIPDLLTYQEVFNNYNLDSRVKEFYRL